MKIKATSSFRDPIKDKQWLESWLLQLEQLNNKKYDRTIIETSLGKTHIFGLNWNKEEWNTIVIFPGARTTSLFWDFDNGLQSLAENFRIYLVETNGLPNFSEGNTPDIKSTGYGEWAAEVLNQLKISKTIIAGASFGGLICMKLCITHPEKVHASFLLNPGCLQPFSLSVKNLYYNLLPIIFPNKKNVSKFLDTAVFSKPEHALPEAYEKLIIEYELFALTRYKDNTQKPYYMGDELKQVTTDIYLLEGGKDLLFPYQTSIENAKVKISSLKETIVFTNVGHGIETYKDAVKFIADKASAYQ